MLELPVVGWPHSTHPEADDFDPEGVNSCRLPWVSCSSKLEPHFDHSPLHVVAFPAKSLQERIPMSSWSVEKKLGTGGLVSASDATSS